MENHMSQYCFSLIIPGALVNHDTILDAVDVLGQAGCVDASIRGHVDGMEVLFEREADNLHEAIHSAILNVEQAGFPVSKVELEREAIMV
jgi:hypothetical protein